MSQSLLLEGFCKKRYSPLRCAIKSAQVVDEKGVAGLRCGQRVRNYMKTKGMNDPEAAADLAAFADKRARNG